jgi:hypothetical protein
MKMLDQNQAFHLSLDHNLETERRGGESRYEERIAILSVSSFLLSITSLA